MEKNYYNKRLGGAWILIIWFLQMSGQSLKDLVSGVPKLLRPMKKIICDPSSFLHLFFASLKLILDVSDYTNYN